MSNGQKARIAILFFVELTFTCFLSPFLFLHFTFAGLAVISQSFATVFLDCVSSGIRLFDAFEGVIRRNWSPEDSHN
jgi:hypothetical protein